MNKFSVYKRRAELLLCVLAAFCAVFVNLPYITAASSEPQIGSLKNAADNMTVLLSGAEYSKYQTEKKIDFDNGGVNCNLVAEFKNLLFESSNNFSVSANIKVTNDASSYGSIRLFVASGVTKKANDKRVKNVELCIRPKNKTVILLLSAGGLGEEVIATAAGTEALPDGSYRYMVSYNNGRVSFWLNGNCIFDSVDITNNVTSPSPKIGLLSQNCSGTVFDIAIFGGVNSIMRNVFNEKNDVNVYPQITVKNSVTDEKIDSANSSVINNTLTTTRYMFSGVSFDGGAYNLSARAAFNDNKTVNNGKECNWEGLIFNIASAVKDNQQYRIELRVRNKIVGLFAVNASTNKETVIDTFDLATGYGTENLYTVSYISGNNIQFWQNNSVVLPQLNLNSYGYENVFNTVGLGGEVCEYSFREIKLWGDGIALTGILPKMPSGNGNYADVMDLKDKSTFVTLKNGIITSADDKVTYKSDYKYVPFTNKDNFVYGADVKVESADKNWKGVRFLLGRDAEFKRYCVYLTGNSVSVMRGDIQLASAKYERKTGQKNRVDMYCTADYISVWLDGVLMIEKCSISGRTDGTIGIWFEYAKAAVSNIDLYYTDRVKFISPKIPVLRDMKKGQYNAAKYMNVTLNNNDYMGYFNCTITGSNSQSGDTYRFVNLPITDTMSYYYRANVRVTESSANWKGPRLIYRTSGAKTFYLVFTQNALLLLADNQVVSTYTQKLIINRSYDTVIFSTPDSVSVWLDGELIFENIDLTPFADYLPLSAKLGVKFELCRAVLNNIQIYGDDVVFDKNYVDEELYNDYYYNLETIPKRPEGNANLFENVHIVDISSGSLGAEYDSRLRFLQNEYNDCAGSVGFYDAGNSPNLNGLKNSQTYVFEFKYSAKSIGVEEVGESGFWFTIRSSSVPGNSKENSVKFGASGDALMISTYQNGIEASKQTLAFKRELNREYKFTLVCGKTWVKVYLDDQLVMVGNQLPYYNTVFNLGISNTQSVFKDFILYNVEQSDAKVLEERDIQYSSKTGNTLLAKADYSVPTVKTYSLVSVIVFTLLSLLSVTALVYIFKRYRKNRKG